MQLGSPVTVYQYFNYIMISTFNFSVMKRNMMGENTYTYFYKNKRMLK